MGTTSEKLTYLNETKSKLKSAINGIGGELTSDSTFRSYPDEIDNAWNKVFEQLPHVEGTGESITLNNTIQAKMKVNLKGNTSQVSYSGKNLLSVNDYTLEVYKTINIETISAGTYTFSGNVVSSDTDASTCLVIFRNGSTSVLTKYVSRGDFSISITLGNSIDNITIYAGSNYNNSVGDTATYKNMMISVNGETYEPYCGGTPSPNPSYPQDIHSVSGDNNITISNSDNTQSATYPINLGTYELNKIGDYQDYFYKNVVGASDYSSDRELNAWYLKKNIGKITINVSTASDWAYINGAFQSNSAVPSDIVDISSSLNAYTNTFTYEYHASGITGNLSNGAFGWNSSKKITFKIDNMTSKQDYIDWFTSNITCVLYPLATPIYIPITGTLATQLENVYNASSYKGQTNISQVNNDKAFIIDVEAIMAYTSPEESRSLNLTRSIEPTIELDDTSTELEDTNEEEVRND